MQCLTPLLSVIRYLFILRLTLNCRKGFSLRLSIKFLLLNLVRRIKSSSWYPTGCNIQKGFLGIAVDVIEIGVETVRISSNEYSVLILRMLTRLTGDSSLPPRKSASKSPVA